MKLKYLLSAAFLFYNQACFSSSYPDELYDRLGQLETRGERYPYRAVQRDTRCMGKYQMGKGMLQDLGYVDERGRWTREARKYGIESDDDFLKSHSFQERVIREAFRKNREYIRKILHIEDLGDIDRRYSEFGVLAAAHLVGAEAVCRTYDPRSRQLHLSRVQDEIGTKAEKYARKLTRLDERLSIDD